MNYYVLSLPYRLKNLMMPKRKTVTPYLILKAIRFINTTNKNRVKPSTFQCLCAGLIVAKGAWNLKD